MDKDDLLYVKCRFLPESQFRWIVSQRLLSPRSLFWSQCEGEPLLWAHFNLAVTHSWGMVGHWKTRVRATRSSLGPAVFSYLAIFQSRCKFCSFYFNLYWLLTKAECIIQLFEPTSLQERLTHICGRILVNNIIICNVALVSYQIHSQEGGRQAWCILRTIINVKTEAPTRCDIKKKPQ